MGKNAPECYWRYSLFQKYDSESEFYLFDASTGKIVAILNYLASLIFKLYSKGFSIEEMCAKICQIFPSENFDNIENDVKDIIQEFKEIV